MSLLDCPECLLDRYLFLFDKYFVLRSIESKKHLQRYVSNKQNVNYNLNYNYYNLKNFKFSCSSLLKVISKDAKRIHEKI